LFRLCHAAALAVAFGWAWLSPPPALAQVGGLIVTMTSPASGSTARGTATYSVPWDTADGDLPAERELSTLVLVQALSEAHGGGRLALRLSHRPAAPSCRRRPEG